VVIQGHQVLLDIPELQVILEYRVLAVIPVLQELQVILELPARKVYLVIQVLRELPVIREHQAQKVSLVTQALLEQKVYQVILERRGLPVIQEHQVLQDIPACRGQKASLVILELQVRAVILVLQDILVHQVQKE